jgi:site-specific DNA recombinase
MTRVAGYGRVSTQEQVLQGTSARDQRKQIEKECIHRGYRLYKFYSDDGISGKSLKARPGIQQLISDAETGKFDVVMFTKLDRIGRNQRDLHNFWHLMQKKVKLSLYCIKDPSVNSDGRFGKLMLGILATFAEFERDLIKERTAAGRKYKWKNSESYPGTPPYGYRWNKERKQIEIVPEQREIYERIVSLYLDQHYSLKDIANILSNEGIPTPSAYAKKWKTGKSTRWNNCTLGKILRKPAYKGEDVYNKFYHKQLKDDKPYMEPDKNSPKPEEDWIRVEFPPMISEERWNLIQERREQQKLKPKKRHKGYENHFLAKKALGKSLLCGECGATMTQRLRARNGNPLVYYLCNWKVCSKKELDLKGRDRCILKAVNSEYVDMEVFKSVVQLLSSPFHFGKEWLVEHDTSEIEKEIENLEERLKNLDRKIDKAYHLITEEEDSEVEKRFKEKLREDQSERSRLKSKLALKKSELRDKSNSMDRLKELQDYLKKNRNTTLSEFWRPSKFEDQYGSKFKKFLFDLPFEQKRRLLEAVIAPEAGGEVYIRHMRHSDYLDGGEFVELTREEREWDRKNPLKDEDPIVDIRLSIDINRLKAVIAGLDRGDLLDKFGSCAIPGKGKDAH